MGSPFEYEDLWAKGQRERREKREREEAEYARREAEEALERQQRNERALRAEYKQEMQSAQTEREELYDYVRQTRHNKQVAYDFIKHKGLWEEFIVWEPEPGDVGEE
jgi:hypothetical protein